MFAKIAIIQIIFVLLCVNHCELKGNKAALSFPNRRFCHRFYVANFERYFTDRKIQKFTFNIHSLLSMPNSLFDAAAESHEALYTAVTAQLQSLPRILTLTKLLSNTTAIASMTARDRELLTKPHVLLIGWPAARDFQRTLLNQLQASALTRGYTLLFVFRDYNMTWPRQIRELRLAHTLPTLLITRFECNGKTLRPNDFKSSTSHLVTLENSLFDSHSISFEFVTPLFCIAAILCALFIRPSAMFRVASKRLFGCCTSRFSHSTQPTSNPKRPPHQQPIQRFLLPALFVGLLAHSVFSFYAVSLACFVSNVVFRMLLCVVFVLGFGEIVAHLKWTCMCKKQRRAGSPASGDRDDTPSPIRFGGDRFTAQNPQNIPLNKIRRNKKKQTKPAKQDSADGNASSKERIIFIILIIFALVIVISLNIVTFANLQIDPMWTSIAHNLCVLIVYAGLFRYIKLCYPLMIIVMSGFVILLKCCTCFIPLSDEFLENSRFLSSNFQRWSDTVSSLHRTTPSREFDFVRTSGFSTLAQIFARDRLLTGGVRFDSVFPYFPFAFVFPVLMRFHEAAFTSGGSKSAAASKSSQVSALAVASGFHGLEQSQKDGFRQFDNLMIMDWSCVLPIGFLMQNVLCNLFPADKEHLKNAQYKKICLATLAIVYAIVIFVLQLAFVFGGKNGGLYAQHFPVILPVFVVMFTMLLVWAPYVRPIRYGSKRKVPGRRSLRDFFKHVFIIGKPVWQELQANVIGETPDAENFEAGRNSFQQISGKKYHHSSAEQGAKGAKSRNSGDAAYPEDNQHYDMSMRFSIKPDQEDRDCDEEEEEKRENHNDQPQQSTMRESSTSQMSRPPQPSGTSIKQIQGIVMYENQQYKRKQEEEENKVSTVLKLSTKPDGDDSDSSSRSSDSKDSADEEKSHLNLKSRFTLQVDAEDQDEDKKSSSSANSSKSFDKMSDSMMFLKSKS